MSLASTSRGQIAYIEEATFGVIPVAGTPRDLRITGESLDYAITKEQSAEINSTRAVSSVVPVGATTSGGLQGEMQYAEYDEFMAAVLQNDFAAYGTNGVGTTFTADFTATTITAAVAPTGANAFTTLKKGQWFKINAPTSANHGKFLRVSKTTAPTSTVITLDTNTPAVVVASVANCSVATSRLTNGTDQRSYSIERKVLDNGTFMTYRGQTASKLSLSIQSGSLSSISIDFMGKDMIVDDSATNLPGGGTTTASYAYDIHSGVSGTDCQIWIDGPLTGTYVKSLTFDYDNALRAQDALCVLGSVGIGSGQIVCTMSAQIYFANIDLYNSFLANEYPEVIFSSIDPVGNGYFFTLPRANISTVKTNMGAKDQDMMLDVTFTCVRDAGNADATLRQVVFIDRVGAAVS